MYIFIGDVPCLSVYLWPSGGFKYRELYHPSSLAGTLPETMLFPTTHCVLTHSSRFSPSTSGHVCESLYRTTIQTRHTRPSSVIDND